jgi:hypothetical protein
MSLTVHVKGPAVFPMRCVRCMSTDCKVNKFTDSADAVIAGISVSATIEIPICDQCHRAARPWMIGFWFFLACMIVAGIPFVIAQDNHQPIPTLVPLEIMLCLILSLVCGLVARIKAPVRLVANKID